ncbi:MAG: PKD domain-containing protein [Bacteroidetes bacterium]|nr:MAG: PKD domain-containing protein [Bacteroidota bacterium]
MRHKLQIFAICMLFMSNSPVYAASPPVFDWQRCLGGSGQDMPVRILKGNDGYNYLLGSTGSNNGDVTINRGSIDIWLVKQDTLGKIVWERSYGGSNMDIGTAFSQLPDGGFILSGYTASNNGNFSGNKGNFDAFLIRTDNHGNILWQKLYGGSQVDLIYSMFQSQDGGFILVGGTYSNDGDVSNNMGDQDFWILKTDSTGSIIWSRSIGGSGLDVCHSLTENSAGEIIASGTTNSSNGHITRKHFGHDFWVVKLSSQGNLLWEKCYGGNDQDAAFSICRTSSGQYSIAGYSKSSDGDLISNNGYNDYWIIIIDEIGNLLMQKNYGGSGAETVYSVIQTVDGGFLLTGGTTSNDGDIKVNYGLEDIWLVKIDRNLNIEWTKNYGGRHNERPCNVIQNADEGFTVASYSYSNDLNVSGNHGTSDFWIFRLRCKTPNAEFNFLKNVVCEGQAAILNNLSTDATAYSWKLNRRNISDSENPVLPILNPGLYGIELTAFTCYNSDTFSGSYTVQKKPLASIISNEPVICSGSSVTLSSSLQGNCTWNTLANSTSILVYHAGNYWVDVESGACIVRSDTLTLLAYPLPAVYLGPDTSICSPGTLTLNAPSGMDQYMWSNLATANSILVNTSGTYHVTVSNRYCTNSDSITVQFISCSAPIANFSSNTQAICTGESIQFIDDSENAISWQWTFPGGNPSYSNQQNPQVVYNTPGRYNIILNVTNNNGNHTIMRLNYLTVNQVLKPQVNITSNNLSCIGNYSTYLWHYNGNVVPGAIHQMHVATVEGYYQVEITDENNCKAISDSVPFFITNQFELKNNPPILYLHPNPATNELKVLRTHKASGTLRLLNLMGEVLRNYSASENHEEVISIDISRLSNGTYILEFTGHDGLVSRNKFIKHQ